MEITVAKTAGFCFGVKRAIELSEGALTGKGCIYSVGSIVHNKFVNSELSKKGLRFVKSVEEVPDGSDVIIRAHGVTQKEVDMCKKKQLNIIDTTCPNVKKIHNLVSEYSDKGYKVVIIGDKEHPEVIGISGWINGEYEVLNDIKDLDNQNFDKICVVSQTTMNLGKNKNIVKALKKKAKESIVFDTVCKATEDRQTELRQLAKVSDYVIVIGDKESANSNRLYEIAKKECKSQFIENIDDLDLNFLEYSCKISIMAGASTPECLINEVVNKIKNFNSMKGWIDVGSEVTDFEKMMEDSLKPIQSGSITKGVIANVSNGNIIIDLGLKYDGIMPYSEYSDEADRNPEKELKVGEEMEAYVVRVNDMDGTVLLSRRKVDGMKMWDEIDKWIEEKKPVTVKVVKEVGAGLIANKNGIQIFIPASQLSEKNADLKEYVGRNVTVRLLEVNKDRRKVVASERVIAREEKAAKESEVWNNIKECQELKGTVKQIEKFGAFIDLGGVDGLVHISELSWGRINSPAEVLSIGQVVNVYVISVDTEKKKISLGYRKAEDNPWNNIEAKYKVGDVTEVKIERVVPFGAFAQIELGLEGLIHISQISHKRVVNPADVLKVGQYVNVKIMEIDLDKKKIELSMKELEEPEIELTKKEAKSVEVKEEEQVAEPEKEEKE